MPFLEAAQLFSDLQPSSKWSLKVYEQQPALRVVIRANPQYASHITKRLAPYRAFPFKMRGALEDVATYTRQQMIPETFKAEGPGWPQLAPRTVGERIALGFPGEHPILIRTGDLFKELTERGHPGHIEIIKTGKFARVEIGASSEKFIRNQLGDRALRVPPRPMIPGTGYIPVSDHDRIEIKDIFKNSIRKMGSKK